MHGDIREQNILIKDECVFLIDFDWAGEDEKVVYPALVDSSKFHAIHVHRLEDIRQKDN